MDKNTKIADVMTALPHSIGSDQSVAVAKKMLHEYRIRHLPVREGGNLIGIVSERDLWFALKDEKTEPEQLKIKDVFTPEPYSVTPETTVVEVAHAMAEQGIGCVLVVQQGQLVGIFTTVDACRLLGQVLS